MGGTSEEAEAEGEEGGEGEAAAEEAKDLDNWKEERE